VLFGENFLIISGGIHLITKELDDLWALNLVTGFWTELQRSSSWQTTFTAPSPTKVEQLQSRVLTTKVQVSSFSNTNPDPSPYLNLTERKKQSRLSNFGSSRSLSKT